MNKSEQRGARLAVNYAKSNPWFAAATLAPLLRSCSNRSLPELMGVMNDNNLRNYMEVVNGCYVAKEPATA